MLAARPLVELSQPGTGGRAHTRHAVAPPSIAVVRALIPEHASRGSRAGRQLMIRCHDRRVPPQTDAMVIEDLHVKGVVRNRQLARAISDRGLGRFRYMLTYKAETSGVALRLADRWFPSTKRCRCGAVNGAITLAETVFVYTACGCTDDRDFHAADNSNG